MVEKAGVRAREQESNRDARVFANKSPGSTLQVLLLTEYCGFKRLQETRQLKT